MGNDLKKLREDSSTSGTINLKVIASAATSGKTVKNKSDTVALRERVTIKVLASAVTSGTAQKS